MMSAYNPLLLPRLLLLGSWLVFLVTWLFFAFGNKRTVEREPIRQRISYFVTMFIGIWLIGHQPLRWRFLIALDRVPVGSGLLLHWIGATCGVAGVALALWARRTLGTNWSGTITLKRDHELVTNGPYALVRHPIYTAVMLLLTGIVLFKPSPATWLGLLFCLLSFWTKLRYEERLMLRQFPEAYGGYMARTARLVPHLL